MKKILLLLGLFAPVLAFAQGVFIPARTVTGTVNGITRPIAGATVTVCAANTAGTPCSPALANATFKDSGLSIPLANPFTTDANGNYPQVAIAGGNYTITETAPGFTGFSYQITVSCAPGGACSVTTLNATSATITGALTAGSIPSPGPIGGTTPGTALFTSINQRCMADQQTGADMGAKIVACHGTLPATGGIIDATGFQGNQVCSTDWANSLTKPVTVLLGNSTLKCNSAQGLTFSGANITVQGVTNSSAGNGSVIASQGTIANFIHITGTNVTFKNFRVDVSASACNVTNAIFDDVGGTSFTMQGVYVLGGANSDAGNCGSTNIQGNQYTIVGNTFDTIGTSLTTFGAIDGQVIQNFFVNFRLALYNQTTSNNTVISGNVFQSVAGSGIVAGLDAILQEGSGHITIVGNVIKQSREHGIYIASKGGGTVPNTQIDVSGNTIFGIPATGIKVHSSFTNFPDQQITIASNTISCGSPTAAALGTSGGVVVDQSYGVSVTGNTERFCQVGCDVEGLINGLTITGNTFEYNTAAGLFLRDSSGALRNINIAGNQFNNNNIGAGGFAGFQLQPDNGGAGGGTNVNTNILLQENEANDYQTTFPAQTTTAANVTSNVATLTMTNNPIGTGFFVNAQAVVSGFTGADTIFNGTFTLTSVTSTTITYALVHANATASTNGSVTMAATQNIGITLLGPTNGSAVNNVRVLDNTFNPLNNNYSIGTGYTASFLRHTQAGSPNSPSVAIPGFVGSEYSRTDGPPWKYVKNSGDGTNTGWIALAPTNKAMASSSGAITTNVQGQPGGMTAFTWNVDATTTYSFDCELYYQISSVTGVPSPAMAVGGTATYTSLWAAADGYQTTAMTTAGSVVTAAASASTLVTTASTPTATNLPFRFRGQFVVNAAGTFLVTMANSLNGGASVTIGSGGSCSLYQVQ